MRAKRKHAHKPQRMEITFPDCPHWRYNYHNRPGSGSAPLAPEYLARSLCDAGFPWPPIITGTYKPWTGKKWNEVPASHTLLWSTYMMAKEQFLSLIRARQKYWITLFHLFCLVLTHHSDSDQSFTWQRKKEKQWDLCSSTEPWIWRWTFGESNVPSSKKEAWQARIKMRADGWAAFNQLLWSQGPKWALLWESHG